MDSNRTAPAELLQAAFNRLPDKLRELLYLIRVEQVSDEDAAARFGISVEDVERRLAQALARLDRDLEQLKWHKWRRW